MYYLIANELLNQLVSRVEEVATAPFGRRGYNGLVTLSEFPKSHLQDQELLSLDPQSQVSDALSTIPHCFY